MIKSIISLLVALIVSIGCIAQSYTTAKYNVSYLNMHPECQITMLTTSFRTRMDLFG